MTSAPHLDNPGDLVPENFVFPGTEDIDPAVVFSGPGYTAPPPHTNGAAQAALVCALLSFIPFVGLLAVAFGAWGVTRIRSSYDTGLSSAWAGIVVGAAACVIWVWIYLLYFLLRGA